MGRGVNEILREVKMRQEVNELKPAASPNDSNPLLENSEVNKVVGGVRQAFEKLYEQIPKTEIQDKDPNDEWSYTGDVTHISSKCEKEIVKLRNELIGQHSVLLQFIRENQISEHLTQQIGRKIKGWETKAGSSLRREYLQREHDELMQIIKHPLQARMSKN